MWGPVSTEYSGAPHILTVWFIPVDTRYASAPFRVGQLLAHAAKQVLVIEISTPHC